MFENIRKAKTKIKNQEVSESGEVVLKQRGRPKKPHMKKIQIRLTSAMNDKLSEKSISLGLGKSQVIAIALNNFFEKEID